MSVREKLWPLRGNRAERRAQQQGKAPRRPPTLDELPAELQPMIATASNLAVVEQMLRSAHGIEGFSHQQVHQAISWLRSSCEGTWRTAAEHPRFAEFFPEVAAKLQGNGDAGRVLGPDGQPAAVGA